mgnify:CR=1 FL=1
MEYPFLTAAAVWAVWNLITFGMMGIDKYKAEHGKWRVSEKALLLSAFLMGAVGSLAGSRIFHHKTKKLPAAGPGGKCGGCSIFPLFSSGFLIWKETTGRTIF